MTSTATTAPDLTLYSVGVPAVPLGSDTNGDRREGGAVPLTRPCDNCGRLTPIYRLAAVILDGRIASVCPACAAREHERMSLPYAPRPDQGAIQPSTTRDVW